MIDIVFPSGNEEQFISVAQRLGIKGLIFVYEHKEQIFKKKTNFPMQTAVLSKPEQAKQLHNQGYIVFCKASREAIEQGADIVFGFETLYTKDHTHYRASGLNQVLCNLANQKKVQIGFSLSLLLAADDKNRAILFGRMAQNGVFCSKYNAKMRFASFARDPYHMRSPTDICSLFTQLGIPQDIVQLALG